MKTKLRFNNRMRVLIVRITLGLLFIYAGVLKIGASQEFAESIAAYNILPGEVINLLALGLPPFEIACGLMVLTGFHLRTGSLGILLMLVVFLGAIISALFRGLSIDCGCFGKHSWFDANPLFALGRDVVLLLFAAWLYKATLARPSLEPTKASSAGISTGEPGSAV